MKIAVISLCRDRIEYSQHCFARLHELAGCEFDHYVLDQGSTDGTFEWLSDQFADGYVDLLVREPENIGISKGLNLLLDHLSGYDVVVKVDNDCELVTPNTLRDVAQAALDTGWFLSPVISGIGSKMVGYGEKNVGGYLLEEKQQIPGCFMAIPADWFQNFRYSESNPTWGKDDAQICYVARRNRRHCGYLLGYEANHYETTEGQEARYPEYFAQKVREGLPWE